MPALILIISFLVASDVLPGEAFARPQGDVVLFAGASTNHAGAYTLRPDDVVRIGAAHGDLVEVFVPQGFAAYLHGDFLEHDVGTSRVTVRGENVNLRLLPSVLGLPPVGRISPADGPLTLLDVEHGWARVLAPLHVPLFAPRAQLPAVADGEARPRWDVLHGQRERRRLDRVEARLAVDPEQRARRAAEAELEALSLVDVTLLDEAGLTARVAALRALQQRSLDASLAARVGALVKDTEQESSDRRMALTRVEDARREEAREASRVLREARILDLGLRFLGKGDDRRVEGVVNRRAVDDSEAAVYTVREDTGTVFKLSLAPELGSLASLAGKRVVLRGRTMPLMNVEGRVLIVDAFDVVPGP